MKKIFPIFLLGLGFLLLLGPKEQQLMIPEQSIRFRIIANSNDQEDQKTKESIATAIQTELYESLKESKNIIQAREITKQNLTKYHNIVERTLNERKSQEKFTVDYGLHYFPEKVYKGVKYNAGYYESLIVTLGQGQGDNWWCVLFPPLCLLEAEETEETTEVEYQFFIKELLDKYF